MILCRKCTARHDDGVEECTECGADLTGAGALRLGTAMRTDWNPAEARPVARTEPPPGEPPAPEPDAEPPPTREPPAPRPPSFGESGVIVRPDREQPRPADEPEPPRRRGRRPGDVADDDVEPETNEITPTVHAAPPADGQPAAPDSTPREPALVGPPPSESPPQSDAAEPGAGPAVAEPMRSVPQASFVSLGDGEVACSSCRRANPETRRFCSYCASTLPAFGVEPDVVDEPTRPPLIRRLLRTTKKPGSDNRTFGQRAKDSGQQKLKYRAQYTLKSRLRAIGYIGGGVAGLLIMLGPVRSRVMTLVNPPDPISVEQVQAEGTPTFEEEAFAPDKANDGDPETAFVLPWTGDPVDFSFQLPSGRSPSKIEFETGYPNSDHDRGSVYLRPHEVELSAAGEVQTITLDDHEGPQQVGFDLPDDASQVIVRIISVHEQTWPTYERVAIAEIKIVR